MGVPAFDVMDENILKVVSGDHGEYPGVSTYCVWQTLRQHLGYRHLSWNTVDKRLWRLNALGFVSHTLREEPGRVINYWKAKKRRGRK